MMFRAHAFLGDTWMHVVAMQDSQHRVMPAVNLQCSSPAGTSLAHTIFNSHAGSCSWS